MKKYKKSLFIVMAIFPILVLAQANSKGVKINEPRNDTGSVYAIVIGVSNYTTLPKLQYADKDAAIFYQYLKEITPEKDSSKLYLLLNSNATRDEVFSILYDITNKIKAGDKVIFYFSGHGDMEQLIQTSNALLLLSKCEATGYRRKNNYFLDIMSLKEYFETWMVKKANLLFVCDACHSGSLSGGEAGRKNNLLGLQQAWSQEIKLLSCQPDEVSLEGKQWGGGRGLFSFYFLQGLKGLADQNKNSSISLFELKNYLESNVSNSSGQAQIPSVQGDLKYELSKVTDRTIASANKEKKNGGDENAIVLKSISGDLIGLIKDSIGREVYKSYKNKLVLHRIISPEQSCAYYYYKLFEKNNGNMLVRNNMRMELISELQQSFDLLLDYVYQDSYEKMGLYEKMDIESMLTIALELAGNNKMLANQIQSKLYFYNACELTLNILPGRINYQEMERLQQGIDFLKKAIAIDPLSPNLYLKLGDYYLYTNKFSSAVTAYLQYQQILPNDGQSYNKLGMGYMATRQFDLAIVAFKQAVKLNPNYYKAVDNLRIAKEKKG